MFYRSTCVGLLAGALAISSGCGNGDRSIRIDSNTPKQMSTMGSHTTTAFAGVKVNGGSVTHSKQDGKSTLTLSDDFVIPQTPAPHWQVVDSSGNRYLLQRLSIKGDKFNKSIVVPAYVKEVAKVQIWCAYAETVLGEASFDKPVK